MRYALVALLLAACGSAGNADNNARAQLVPEERIGPALGEHGGVVAASGGLFAEFVPQSHGKLLAWVRGPQGLLRETPLQLTVRDEDGTSRIIPLAWDPSEGAHMARLTNIEPGQKTVTVTLSLGPGAPMQTVSARLSIADAARIPAARHGGTVELVGDYAIELVPSSDGSVAFYVMDLDGNIVNAPVEFPTVTIASATRTAAGVTIPSPSVQARATQENDHFVVRPPAPSTPNGTSYVSGVAISLSVGERQWTHATLPAQTFMAPQRTMQAPVNSALVPPPQPTVAAAPTPTINAGAIARVTALQRPSTTAATAQTPTGTMTGSVGFVLPAQRTGTDTPPVAVNPEPPPQPPTAPPPVMIEQQPPPPIPVSAPPPPPPGVVLPTAVPVQTTVAPTAYPSAGGWNGRPGYIQTARPVGVVRPSAVAVPSGAATAAPVVTASPP